MKGFSVFPFLLVILSIPLAADTEWSGTWTTGLSFSRWEDPRWKSQWSDLELELSSRGEDLEWLVSAEAELDLLNQTEEASLDEIWLDYRSHFGRWTIGRQRISWGQSLVLGVLDILCPEDYTDLFRGTYDSDPLSVWALRWQLDMGSVLTEMVYMPEFRPAVLPAGTVPSADLPTESPLNGEWGARSRFFFPFGDLGVAAFYGWDDQPVVVSHPTAGLSAAYHPYWLVGWDAAIPAGPLLIRLENGWDLNRSFSRMEPEAFLSHRLSVLAGVDWMPTDWTITAEVYGSHRFKNPENATDDSDQLQIAGEANRRFSGSRWELGAGGVWFPMDEDWYLNPRLILWPADGMEVEGGADIPWGNSGLFSGVDKEAVVYLRCSYSF